MKPWIRIVEGYPDFHMGPSIPFVLGAIQEPAGKPFPFEALARLGLGELLEAFRATSKGHGIRIRWCHMIRAHVVTSNPFIDGLHWDTIGGCTPPDFERLFDVLWERYGAAISAGEFSIERRVWRPFTQSEFRTIEETFGMESRPQF